MQFSASSDRLSPSSLALSKVSMPITEQEAAAWVGPYSADQLVPLPTERLNVAQIRPMVDFRTAVIHCFIPGGSSPPLFQLPDGTLQTHCQRVLELDALKREEIDQASSNTRMAFASGRQDQFIRTFGHLEGVLGTNLGKYPFVKVSSCFIASLGRP